MAQSLPADLAEMVARPPVYQLLGVADKLAGSHTSHAWKGLAGIPGSDEPGLPVVVKLLEKRTQLEIELACGLASQALKLPVPKPALVRCFPDDLPACPAIPDGTMLFGSLFQAPDPFLAKHVQDGGDMDDYLWRTICNHDVGPQGAAWDELVANPDRHIENLIFDGRRWWLFDHNRALAPLNKMYQASFAQSEKAAVVEYVAKVNQLLSHLLELRPNDHGIRAAGEKLQTQKRRLQALAHGVRQWQFASTELKATFEMVALVIDMIALRLNPLPLYLNQRLAVPSGESLWKSSDE